MNKEIKVKTKGGYLWATDSGDIDYPGIDIEFVADNEDENVVSRPRVLFEYPIDGKLRMVIWDDKNNKDYTREIVFDIQEETTMSRIDNIKAYAQEKAQKEKEKEKERQFKCEELTKEIKALKPRIKELIEVGNACLVNGIKLTGQAWGGHEGYDTHQFITNCWSHLVGFVQNGKSAIFELGINAGGACGKWDFRTDGNKVYDIHEETKEHREASLEHMQKFINRFDEFETTFYEYIDGITNK